MVSLFEACPENDTCAGLGSWVTTESNTAVKTSWRTWFWVTCNSRVSDSLLYSSVWTKHASSHGDRRRLASGEPTELIPVYQLWLCLRNMFQGKLYRLTGRHVVSLATDDRTTKASAQISVRHSWPEHGTKRWLPSHPAPAATDLSLQSAASC